MSKLTVPVGKKDHTDGPASAPVTIVEYGDYECPYCGEAYFILKKIRSDVGGRLRFVFRNFPLSQLHPHALQAALSAEAAGRQEKFWEMHDLLFEHQGALEEQDLVSYAYLLELDVERFLRDMQSEQVQGKVHNDFWSGIRSGVNGTPTFFINGERHDGSYSYGDLRTAIEQAAKRKVAV